jgi:segregation and condensation protein B
MRDGELCRLEAILFMARGSLTSRKLAQFAGLADGTQARTLVRRLNEFYEPEGSAFRVEEVAGGFRLMTRPCFGPWLRRLHNGASEVRLSTPALETLAVIAYRQPVLRAELESIRGVQCGEMLRQLSDRDLVRIVGRSPELGRPFLYGTTKRFLQAFGLKSLEELPRAETLRQGAAAQPREPFASMSSEDPSDSQEESEVKIALFPEPAPQEESAGAFAPQLAEPLTPLAVGFAGDEAPVVPSADAEFDDDEGDEEEYEDEGDEDEDLDDDEADEDFEDEDWEEVEDDEDDDWDEDEDWDEEDDDEDEDWEDDAEEEEED